MHACFEPAALHHWVHRVCGGADDIAAADRFFCGGHGDDFDAGFLAHFGGELLAILFCRTVYFDLGERPYRQVRRDLCSGLFTGTKKSQDFASFRARYLLATALVAPPAW